MKYPNRLTVISTAAMLASLLAGCGLRMPNIAAPGYLYEQQLRATFHDPYPALEVAPEIEGGRPPDFDLPRPQSVKSQWFFDSGPPL